MTAAGCFNAFRDAQQLENCPGFQLENQGTMLMLLYGLLVVPREMWRRPDLPDFPFDTRNLFQFETGDQNMDIVEFLRSMRNAVAHASFDVVNLDPAAYRFWNERANGVVNFAVQVLHSNLGLFITEVGTYYINRVLPHLRQDVGQ